MSALKHLRIKIQFPSNLDYYGNLLSLFSRCDDEYSCLAQMLVMS